jgi:hypothetical protein
MIVHQTLIAAAFEHANAKAEYCFSPRLRQHMTSVHPSAQVAPFPRELMQTSKQTSASEMLTLTFISVQEQ